MKWLIALAVVIVYVHLFNAVANRYFESGRTLTFQDIYRKMMPPVKITVEL
jgi:hypothetical protein